MTDTVVILNPTAGNLETVRDWQERVESIVRGLPIRITSHPGEAEALARRAVEEGFARVVAAGGDGTVNHELRCRMRPTKISHFFGTFIDQKNNQLHLGMILSDRIGDVMQQRCLPGARRRDKIGRAHV